MGEQTPLFRRMALRAGSLVPDEVSDIIISEIEKRLGPVLEGGKPIFVTNSNPLAKWLNLLLIAGAASYPERLKGNELAVDPFVASLAVFDFYFGREE